VRVDLAVVVEVEEIGSILQCAQHCARHANGYDHGQRQRTASVLREPSQRFSFSAHVSHPQQIEGALLAELLQKVAILFRARCH
jgi:hypothetical protein